MAFSNDANSRSRLFESLIVNQLGAEFFWRDPRQHEVGMVLPQKEPVPIEVKYGDVGFDGLEAFAAKFKTKKGYIVSYNKEETKKGVRVISAHKALAGRRFA